MHDLAFLLYKKLNAANDDLYAIPYHLTVERCRAKLERYWDMELAKEKPSLIKALAFTYKPIVTGFTVTFVEARANNTTTVLWFNKYRLKPVKALSNDKQATTGHIITMIQGDVELVGLVCGYKSPDTDVAVSIVDGTFAYEEIEILKNIQLHVPKGSFTAVIGKVGRGKSTLLHALLGEIIKISGDVQVNGSVVYAAQTAWIMNQSIRENILFGDEMDEDKYKRVCLACDLYPDFQSLPNEDQTLVGPKGISLSGGQKARISLARALYSSSDVVQLDDPLSAVDAHVEKHIVDSLFGNEGVLQGKTVVLVTHAIHHLDRMNQVILIEDGQIAESGSYEEPITYGFMENSMISLERIAVYSKLEEEAASDTDYPLEKSWPKNGSIQLENYSTTYAKHLDPVIKNLSVNIKGGEKVGIVGRT
ncbi:Canalicular multispecific organic anion transporter 2, partial [Globomyces sp. JEL0801]